MEEIKLKWFLKLIVEKRRLIIYGTLVVFIASLVVNLWVLDPQYEYKTTIIVSPIDIKSGISSGTTVILSGDLKYVTDAKKVDNKMLGSILSQVRYPQIPINTMVKYLDSDDLLQSVFTGLGINYKKYDYKNLINVEMDPKTFNIDISVKYKDADKAVAIANAMIKQFSEVVAQKSGEQIKKTEDMLLEREKAENVTFEGYKKELNEFIVSNGGTSKIDDLSPDKQLIYRSLNDKYTLSQQSLDAYNLVLKELNSVKTLNIADLMDTQIIYRDKLPLKPISHKLLNIILCTYLGLMILIILAAIIGKIETLKKNGALKLNI